MAKYSKSAQKSVEQAMRKKKRGKLESGGSGRKVKSRKQAIAIGLSEARKKGAKVPPPPKGSGSAGRTSKKSPKKKASKKKKGRKPVRKKAPSKRSGKRPGPRKKKQ